ncbi:MAG: transcription elongation factor Spt5 [Candidatus Poseidoniaceae archaeon]|jgi:transcriptional antiterminator NusG|nr:transcription elongation factor Spt5 [Candidatus Poseidoniaceae archaeon]
MTESFVAFVRHGEKVLLLRRSDSDVDYPLLWDGIYGIGTTAEEVVERVSAATGLEPDQLEIHGHGRDRGVEIGGRLQDITPWLVYATTDEVTAGAIYTDTEWVDPGKMQEYNLVFTDLQLEGSERILRDLYGSAGSFLYIVKTAISSEQRVADEMHARLSGSGSLSDVQDEIFSVLHPNGMRGYLFVESSAQHHVEKLIGRTGGRDRKTRGPILSTPLKNAKSVLGSEAPLEDVLPYLEPKAVTSGIEVGCIVEIVSGAFKGEKARVVSVSESKEEVSMELYEQPIPMTLNMRGDHVRVIERVE